MSNPNVSQQEAAKYLLSLKKASLSYKGYVDFMHPDFDRAPFQDELVDVLNMLEQDALVSAGGNPIRKLLVNMPPRHAKTFYGTVNFSAYALGRKPFREVMNRPGDSGGSIP